MNNFKTYKNIALALRNCTCIYQNQKWNNIGWMWFEDEIVKVTDYVNIFPSNYHNYKTLNKYFKLFKFDLNNLDNDSPIYEPKHVSNILKNYLSTFNILVGIPIHGYNYAEEFQGLMYPVKFYQLLIYFLHPFGNIGFVPMISCWPSTFEAATLPLPYSYVEELDSFEPQRLVISGKDIMKLNLNKPNTNFKPLDISVFFNYWNEKHQNSFLEYMLNNYQI